MKTLDSGNESASSTLGCATLGCASVLLPQGRTRAVLLRMARQMTQMASTRNSSRTFRAKGGRQSEHGQRTQPPNVWRHRTLSKEEPSRIGFMGAQGTQAHASQWCPARAQGNANNMSNPWRGSGWWKHHGHVQSAARSFACDTRRSEIKLTIVCCRMCCLLMMGSIVNDGGENVRRRNPTTHQHTHRAHPPHRRGSGIALAINLERRLLSARRWSACRSSPSCARQCACGEGRVTCPPWSA